MELCFPFCESESEWGRSDLVNGLCLPTFCYVQGRSSHKSAGHNNHAKLFLSPKIPSLSLREEVSELSAPLSTPHSRVELPQSSTKKEQEFIRSLAICDALASRSITCTASYTVLHVFICNVQNRLHIDKMKRSQFFPKLILQKSFYQQYQVDLLLVSMNRKRYLYTMLTVTAARMTVLRVSCSWRVVLRVSYSQCHL